MFVIALTFYRIFLVLLVVTVWELCRCVSFCLWITFAVSVFISGEIYDCYLDEFVTVFLAQRFIYHNHDRRRCPNDPDTLHTRSAERTCAGRPLPSDVIACVNTLMIVRRGFRAGRKLKLKLLRRALVVRHNDPGDMIDVLVGSWWVLDRRRS